MNAPTRAQRRKPHPRYVKLPQKRTVKVKPHTYQPSKAELEADVSIPDGTPEEVVRAMRNVEVVEAS